VQEATARLKNVIEDDQLDNWLALRDFTTQNPVNVDHRKSEWGVLALLIIDLGLATYVSLS
jgi:hypothetical protein